MSTLPPASAQPAAPTSGTEHDALPPGTRFGEFEILRVLGVGGFGIVYLAKDHSLERDVALKEYMPASLAARGQGPQITVRSSAFAETYAIGLRSFVNEARLLARFDHPSLVKVYRFWEDNATAYMVMPFLQGTTLRDTRRAMAHPPNEAWIRSVIAPILSALELLHREGVYHRDIAPDNILLPHDGPPVLLDFGAARRVISGRTQSLTAILKPSYAPIEQYAEMAQMRQGPWTDLYALGAVIHYLLFGAPPAPATARAVQDDAESIESRIVPGVSPRFLEAVSWMLSLRPNQRPQNGEQLRAVLDGHAAIPPRGRPGITIPGALTPAAPEAFEPTRLAGGAVQAPLGATGGPTHAPTATAAATAAASAAVAPATFSPTTHMPTARPASLRSEVNTVAPARTIAPPATTQAPARASSTQPPATRPAPLATQPQALGAGAVPVPPARASSMTWLAVAAGGAVVVVVAALAGWQLARQQGSAPAQAAASSPVPGPAAVAGPAAGAGPIAPSGVGAVVAPAVAIAPPPPSTQTQTQTQSQTQTPLPVPSTQSAPPRPTVPPAAIVAQPMAVTPAPAATPALGTAAPPAIGTATVAPPTSRGPEASVRNAATAAVLPDSPAKRPPAAPARIVPPSAETAAAPAVVTRPLQAGATSPLGAASAASFRPQGRPVPQAAVDPPLASTAPSPRAPAYGGAPVSPGYGSEPARPYGPAGQGGQGTSREPALPRNVPVAGSESAAASAREACGKRVFIALAICMDQKCEEPRFRQTRECVGVLARKAARENR